MKADQNIVVKQDKQFKNVWWKLQDMKNGEFAVSRYTIKPPEVDHIQAKALINNLDGWESFKRISVGGTSNVPYAAVERSFGIRPQEQPAA